MELSEQDLATLRLRYLRAALVLGGARNPDELSERLLADAFAAMPGAVVPFGAWVGEVLGEDGDAAEAPPALLAERLTRGIGQPGKGPRTNREWVEFLIGAASGRALGMADLEVPAGA